MHDAAELCDALLYGLEARGGGAHGHACTHGRSVCQAERRSPTSASWLRRVARGIGVGTGRGVSCVTRRGALTTVACAVGCRAGCV